MLYSFLLYRTLLLRFHLGGIQVEMPFSLSMARTVLLITPGANQGCCWGEIPQHHSSTSEVAALPLLR